MTSLVPVVLCGGSGTRFWPLSTDASPKQFLPLWQGRSLFQITLERLSLPGAAAPVIICNVVHEAEVRRQLAAAGVAGATLLLEPERRDSAAAIAAATAWVAAHHGAEVPIGIFPSDQLIRDTAAFARAFAVAADLARDGRLVTFGIRADRPATEFGYVERGAALPGHDDAFAVASFHEKPELAVARHYLDSGRFDWNSGMFAFTAAGFFAEAERHMPAILAAARAAAAAAQPGSRPGTLILDRAAFVAAERKSIDYALFERAAAVATVPLDCGWSDLGNWRSAHAELPKDGAGNVLIGNVKAKDCSNTLIVSNHLPVRVLGVEGLAIVVSPEGVLVTALEQSARLKEVL